MNVIVLAADRGVRRLQTTDSYPRALLSDDQGRRVFDWLFDAFQKSGVSDITVVGGYHIEKLISEFPGVSYFFNADWSDTASAYSLSVAADVLEGPVLISESDVVYHPEALTPMFESDADIALGIVGEGESTEPAAGGFAGMVMTSAAGTAALKAILQRKVEAGEDSQVRSASLPELVDMAKAENGALRIDAVDIPRTDWRSVGASFNMARFVMGSKAQTLERLGSRVKSAIVLDQARFSVGDWLERRDGILTKVAAQFAGEQVIVRSSALDEDSWTNSAAGQYHSVLDIAANDPHALSAAIEEVTESFRARDGVSPSHQVFIQKYLSDVRASGVIFTRDIETLAPYVVVNFDDASGKTDTVTGGKAGAQSTSYALHGRLERLAPSLAPLKALIEELTALVNHDALDIEFAIDGGGACYLLQVRPITADSEIAGQFDERDISDELEAAAAYLEGALQPHPALLGRTSVFANMPDWNPAEIIGATPRPLAMSLYNHLITDETWSRSRGEMMYRRISGVPLVVGIAGRPYVDVRASFNSFIPAAVSDELAEKLVDFYVETLSKTPQLQDKVEFDIVFSCYDFSFDQASMRLGDNGFDDTEIAELRDALKTQTCAIINENVASRDSADVRIQTLGARREAVLAHRGKSALAQCAQLRMLLEDCREFGALSFSNMARQGFVATLMMKSLQQAGVFDAEEIAELYTGLPTVAGQAVDALVDLASGRLTQEQFLETFGHLRPGTYDLLSPSYAEAPSVYLKGAGFADGPAPERGAGRGFTELFMRKQGEIDALCRAHGLDIDAKSLARFIAFAIPGRESAKFEFSKNLSAALGITRRIGEGLGFSAEDMSFLPIGKLLELRARPASGIWVREVRREIESNKKYFTITGLVKLPSVITNPGDVFGFTEVDSWPNFVTRKTIRAPLMVADSAAWGADFKDRIVVIESADPGYDWLFGRNIAGLVTKYGGVASHMAIRCAEFGLPAAIGCGEKIFELLSSAKLIELNCAEQRLSVIE